MKLSKIWVGLILASLLVNVLFLSYLVANNSNLDNLYAPTAHEYLQLQIDIRTLYYVNLVSNKVRSFGAKVYPGRGESDVLLHVNWTSHGDAETKTGISANLAKDMETLLKQMHYRGAWGSNAVITCVQNEFVSGKLREIRRFERHVDTSTR